MTRIELIQTIGNEICESCGPDRDCGLDLGDCDRMQCALSILDSFLEQKKDDK